MGSISFFKKERKFIFSLFLIGFIFGFSFFPFFSEATCPACTVATAGAVGLCRWLKIDDLLSGIWIGAFLISFSFWLSSFLKKREVFIPFQSFFVLFFIYFLTIYSFYYFNIIGNSLNKIYYFDRLLVGIFSGTLCLELSLNFHRFLKKKNEDKSFFPFQKIVIIFSFLIILTFVFYYLFKC